jgi:glycosyltransferase involved in cell wall biosynthesis
MRKRVLLFNFFGGILHRGIPLYVDNLAIALERSGLDVYQVRCPRLIRNLPRRILDLLYVMTEQIVIPLMSIAFDKTVYPYNSVSLFAGMSRSAALVVHDFISVQKRNMTIAALYIKATQSFYAIAGGDVIYASRTTQRIGRAVHRFSRSETFHFPNSFYRFAELRSPSPPPRRDNVLLCSGWGANKDVTGALRLYFASNLGRRRPLHILGMAGHVEAVEVFCKRYSMPAKSIVILPRIDDQAVVRAYEEAAWVWVHSLHEGYGRSVAEARLCGCRVVASNIASFREQKDEFTFLYTGLSEFESAVTTCELSPATAPRREHCEHDVLVAEIKRFIRE